MVWMARDSKITSSSEGCSAYLVKPADGQEEIYCIGCLGGCFFDNGRLAHFPALLRCFLPAVSHGDALGTEGSDSQQLPRGTESWAKKESLPDLRYI